MNNMDTNTDTYKQLNIHRKVDPEKKKEDVFCMCLFVDYTEVM